MPRIVADATYKVQTTDNCWLIVLTNTGAVSVQLPAPGLIFPAGFSTTLLPLNGAAITFTGLQDDSGRTHKINLVDTLTLAQNAGAVLKIQQDMNWYALPTAPSGGFGNAVMPITPAISAGDLALANGSTNLIGTGNDFNWASGRFLLGNTSCPFCGGNSTGTIYNSSEKLTVINNYGGVDDNNSVHAISFVDIANATNPTGVYGSLQLNAPGTFSGAPAAVKGNAYTVPQLTAAIAAAGSGYTNGNVVGIVGGTCTTLLNSPPQFILTVTGGTVTAANYQVGGTGACTVYPANPVSVTGGSGSGLTLNLTNTALDISTWLIGVMGRPRHIASGTVANMVSLFADGAYNTGGGTVTNDIALWLNGPYDSNYTKNYGIWVNSTFSDGVIAGNTNIDIPIVAQGTGRIFLEPGATGYVEMTASLGLAVPLSGTGHGAGVYPYMISTGEAFLDALTNSPSATTLSLRVFNNGTYNQGLAISSAGGVGIAGGSIANLSGGEVSMPKIAPTGAFPGVGTCKEEWVAGTGAGTCKKIAYCGTSVTPTTIIDNVGAAC